MPLILLLLLLLLLLLILLFAFDLWSRKARRAPEEKTGEEARLFERSELSAVPFFPRSAGDRRAAAASVRRKRFW
ncbi:hypothetical protein EPA99_07055 [Pseudoxanthomonas composti]|uniref:Uncharacterized protein n=1 Tax=Pseudoxanthomonas composti TaxID=2137479 RepID=A0A4Q1JZ13_9GAMM|nr:hypothetical protein EPA99_07055 [Pseudoxanthomonas composti]